MTTAKSKTAPKPSNFENIMDDQTAAMGWIYQNKLKLLRIAIILLSLFLLILLAYKTYYLNKSLAVKNQQMKEYAKQIQTLVQDHSGLLSISWKDQKEGIMFTENPCYRVKDTKNVEKKERLKAEITDLGFEVSSRLADIKKLTEKERMFLEQLDKLKMEFEDHKKRVLDEGREIESVGPIFREYR